MRPAFLMLRHSWRQSAAALALFLAGWHATTLMSLARHVEDKFASMAVQSAPEISLALGRGDIVELRNAIGRLRSEGMSGLQFSAADPDAFTGGTPVTIGRFSDDRWRMVEGSRVVGFSGTRLGTISYQADVIGLNALALRGNAFLYFVVAAFMIAVSLLANLGTLRALARMEENLSGFTHEDRPLLVDELKAHLRERSGDEHTDPITRSLFRLLQRYVIEAERAGVLESEARASKTVAALASQLAHDIRSPLGALRSALGGASSPAGESGAVAQLAIARIGEIADDLLRRYKAERVLSGLSPSLSDQRPRIADAAPIINGVIAEKQALRAGEEGPEISLSPSPPSPVKVVPSDFSRLLSNIIGNAVDAAGKAGHVRVAVQSKDVEIHVLVKDDGPGIPQSVLANLMTPGFTHGKVGGSGLGLAHARAALESWGGRLEIESKVGRGTTVRLILPRAEAPDAEPAGGPASAVLIDDDPLVRMNWGVAAKRAGKTLRAYADPASFMKEAGVLPRATPIYLDSDLGGGVKGEDTARELAALGFTELHLETGHDPASFPSLPHLKAVRGKEPPWTAA